MGVKEDIVVSEYTGQTEYSFNLKTYGLTPVNDNGSYALIDSNGVQRATLGDIIIFTADERNNTFGELIVEEITAGQEYCLTIKLDADWLADEKTAYPITIDPTLTYANTVGNIEDLVVGTSTSYSGTASSLYVGRGSSGAKIRTLMRFPNLNILGYNVTSATVSIRDLMCQSSGQYVRCHQYIGNAWSESSTINWAGMGNAPLGIYLSDHSVSYVRGNDPAVCPQKHRYNFDITALAQMWAAGTASPATGIIFKADDDYEANGTKTFKTFASINRGGDYIPNIVVNYETNTPTITISPTNLSVYIGETATIIAETSPTNFDVEFVSADSSIATVNSSTGMVTGVSAGTTTITVSANGVVPKTCSVTVNPVILTLDKQSVSVVPGDTVQLNATTTPSGRPVAFVSSNTSVAEVSESGLITAKAQGSATITASTNGATSQQCTIIVSTGVISVSAGSDHGTIGETILVTATTVPSDRTITWTSDNNSIASVGPTTGNRVAITINGIGQTTITASSPNLEDFTMVVYGVYEDGVYKIRNTGSQLFATLENDRIVNDVNISQYTNQSDARKQLWNVYYIGAGKYTIRSMCNANLAMAVSVDGSLTKNVIAEALYEDDTVSGLTARAKWYFQGTTYSMSVICSIDSRDYKLAVASGDVNNYSNIYAAISGGSTGWRLEESNYYEEGVELYRGIKNVSGNTLVMPIGKNIDLTAIYYGSEVYVDPNFTWQPDKQNVVSVTSDGMITGIGVGETVITVTHTDTGVSNTIIVEIIPIAEGGYYFYTPSAYRMMQPDNNGQSHLEFHSFDGTSQQYWILSYVSDSYYTIRNSSTQLYLTAPFDANDGDGVTQEIYSENISDRQLWKLSEMRSGQYKIQAKAYIHTNLVLAEGVGVYVDGLNVELRNYSFDSIYSDEWFIRKYGKTINVEVVYDEAYAERYSDAVSKIIDATSQINQKYIDTFGVNIEFTSPAQFTSYADECPANYYDYCSCAGDDDDCQGSIINEAFTWQGVYHHKNITNIIARIPRPGPGSYKLAFIGHEICDRDEGQHLYGPYYGLAISAARIATVMHFDSDNQMNVVTTMHELGHLFGADDHYGNGETTTDEMNDQHDTDIYNSMCIYGEQQYDYEVPNQLIICEGCRQTIAENIVN